jgi:hypothetical protein
MAEASRDQNFVPTLTAVLNTDGETIVRVTADPTDHSLSVVNGAGGSDNGPDRAILCGS